MLERLGLGSISVPTSIKQPRKKYSVKDRNYEPALKSRVSKRIRGVEPQNNQSLVQPIPVDPPLPPSILLHSNVSCPFTLASIQVTVLDVGELKNNAKPYWSSPGCKYYHMYPIGYKATKIHFGKEWKMLITDSPSGPVFHVEGNNRSFSGPSPTKPWTDVCIAMASKVGGTRISGPLFFGFSDSVTMRAIENIHNFKEMGGRIGGFMTRKPLESITNQQMLSERE